MFSIATWSVSLLTVSYTLWELTVKQVVLDVGGTLGFKLGAVYGMLPFVSSAKRKYTCI